MSDIIEFNPLSERYVLEDRPTSLTTVLKRKHAKDAGFCVYRIDKGDISRWFWMKKIEGDLLKAGEDYSDELFESEEDAFIDIAIQTKRRSFTILEWENIGEKFQEKYLKKHKLEFQGYTLTSGMDYIEFHDI